MQIQFFRKTLIVSLILGLDILLISGIVWVRSVPRLLCWNIVAKSDPGFFTAGPEGPAQIRYEQPSTELEAFRQRISAVLDTSATDIEQMSQILRYMRQRYVLNSRLQSGAARLRWDGPTRLAEQIDANAIGVNCFHYSILYNTYVQSLGYRSRLWALEGDDGFERFGHTVVEVFVPQYNKWVMFDASVGCYFQKQQTPLSVLETRQALQNNEPVLVQAGRDLSEQQAWIRPFYRRLLQLSLLRSSSDFSTKAHDAQLRWGWLALLDSVLERLPYYPQRALEFLFGRREVFYQYLDEQTFNAQLLSWVSKVIVGLVLLAHAAGLVWVVQRIRRRRG